MNKGELQEFQKGFLDMLNSKLTHRQRVVNSRLPGAKRHGLNPGILRKLLYNMADQCM